MEYRGLHEARDIKTKRKLWTVLVAIGIAASLTVGILSFCSRGYGPFLYQSDNTALITAVPTIQSVLADGLRAQLSWTVNGLQNKTSGYSFNVYRDNVNKHTTSDYDWTDGGLAANTTYTYTVTAVFGGAEGSVSKPFALRTPTVPAACSSFAVSRAGSGAVKVTWGYPASDGRSKVVGYNLYRDKQFLSSASDLTFTDQGLISGHSYSYTVSAINAVGEGAQTAPIVIAM